ncbi:Protein TRANSPARENT TESTA 12 [Carex littledalei]|uniref:Protein TRANSPARENT TESTA 12 n=1 Tax=Carex littledalei TaxID=544730 RepID=A0A833QQG7_9POAL|nr:Protein TRANSPARENT TESTA 12 [Carex littledalei]
MTSALETLCGQAYGAKQYHMLGIYLQRSCMDHPPGNPHHRPPAFFCSHHLCCVCSARSRPRNLPCGRRLAYLFTTSDAVAEAVIDLTPLLAITLLLNSVQPVLSGAAIGAGWQSLVAYVNSACYYLVGVPLGVILGYLIGYEVKGIWMGMIFGTLIQTLVLLFITWRIDWHKEVAIAKALVN